MSLQSTKPLPDPSAPTPPPRRRKNVRFAESAAASRKADDKNSDATPSEFIISLSTEETKDYYDQSERDGERECLLVSIGRPCSKTVISWTS